jgi:hypothetical protein
MSPFLPRKRRRLVRKKTAAARSGRQLRPVEGGKLSKWPLEGGKLVKAGIRRRKATGQLGGDENIPYHWA